MAEYDLRISTTRRADGMWVAVADGYAETGYGSTEQRAIDSLMERINS